MSFWTRITNYYNRTGPRRWKFAAWTVLPPLTAFTFFPSVYLTSPTLPENLATADKAIYVDLQRQAVFAFEQGKVKHRILAVTSQANYRTPPGLYKTSAHDKDYVSKAYNAPMPFAMRVTHWGHYLHAGLTVKLRWRMKRLLPTEMAKNIGSHGCINLEYLDAQMLFDWTPEGTPVLMTYNDPVTDTVYNALMGQKNGMTAGQLHKNVFRETVPLEKIEKSLKVLTRGAADATVVTNGDKTETVYTIRWVSNPELKPS